ncbi:MAG: oligoendopeptidase F [Clostridia bacterium]|nr:oligoendopeptidase F [Clostridia bacterium]
MSYDRNEIKPEYTWDLSKIYADSAAFEAALADTEKKIKAFSKHEKTIIRSAAELACALDDYFAIDALIDRLWSYAYLHFALDTSNNDYQSLTGRVRTLAVSAGSATWFVTPYILRLERSTLEAWLGECEGLHTYRRFLEKTILEKPHTLSDECERLMSSLDNCLGTHDQIRGIFADSDMRFGKIKDEQGKRVELTGANYGVYLRSGERRVRMAAFREMYKTYGSFINTFATVYNGRVKEATTLARVRGYKDSLTASTFRDEVTPEIYNNLIKTVEANLEPLYDYYALKRDALGVDKLHLYDVYAPLVGSLTRKYSYEEAVADVLDTCKIYGEEYYENLKAGLTENRWVDVYPTRGKRGGAFATSGSGTEPFILLNYTENYDDVSTLAHEAGHAMHTLFSTRYNEPHNSNYTIFVAEVASTVNELLLAHRKLAACESDEEKLYILDGLMETYKATLYRQTMFAFFEQKAHALSERGETLTADLLNKQYYKLVKKYFGKDVACDKAIAMEWARIPHFYSCFYVYKYATCISAASAIVKRIETEGEAYVGKYIDFLKCGGAKSPLDSLLVAGIDMRDPAVVSDAIDDFRSCVKQFTEIYNKNK